MFRTILLFLAGVFLAVLVFAPLAIAQVVPDLGAPPATFTLLQWLTVTAAFLGAVSVFMTAVGTTLQVIGMKFPKLEAVAKHFLVWGYDLGKAVDQYQASAEAKRVKLGARTYGADEVVTIPSALAPTTGPFAPVPPANDRPNGFVLVRLMGALALLGILGVTIAPPAAHHVRVPAIALEACTPAQTAQDVATIKTALTYAQTLCIAAQADAPTFGASAATAAEIAAACAIDTALTPLIEQALTDLTTQKAAAAKLAAARAAKARAAP